MYVEFTDVDIYNVMVIKNDLIFKCYSSLEAHSTEQTTFMRVLLPGTHLTAKSTDAMWIKCLAQGHTLMQSGFELSIAISRS